MGAPSAWKPRTSTCTPFKPKPKPPPPAALSPPTPTALATTSSSPSASSATPSALKLIGQYESRLFRDFARPLSQLRQPQSVKRTGRAPLCAPGIRRTGALVGVGQDRAPLSAMEDPVEEMPRNQTQSAAAPKPIQAAYATPTPEAAATSSAPLHNSRRLLIKMKILSNKANVSRRRFLCKCVPPTHTSQTAV